MDLSKIKVKVAADHRSKLDVSGTHITTNNFMLLKPVYYRHMLPTEHLTGNEHVEARMSPLALPTYGRCRINIRNFFVPYRQVFPNWDSYINDTIGVNYDNASLVANVPIFQNNLFVKWFTSYSGPYGALCVAKTLTVTDQTYDFSCIDANSTVTYYVYTYIGRQVMSILTGLGYRINWNGGDTTDYCALSLLCWSKVYCDWFTNSQYLNTSEYIALQKLFKYNDPTGQLVLTYGDFEAIFFFTLFVLYDGQNEYITNAWDNPTNPNGGLESGIIVPDIAVNGSNVPYTNVVSSGSSVPMMFQSTAATGGQIGSQYIHDMLESVTDYVRRHQLVGSREAERALAAFGVNLDSSKVNRSIFISTHTQDIEIGAVMSTADTNGSGTSNLGDYAGAGYVNSGDDIDFQTDEFGMFIAVSSIMPDAGMFQSIDRNNLHTERFDFFTPEFDSAGVQGISRRECYVSVNGSFGTGSQYDQTFGYCPRYAEYKVGRNFVSGLFLSPSALAVPGAWHLFREFDDNYFGSITNVHHSWNFTRGTDATQYTRIFSDMSTDYDKFFMVFHFALQALAPCRSLTDSYDFESKGKELLLESNGIKLN